MKLKVEIDESLVEDEVVIRARELNEEILRMQKLLSQRAGIPQKVICFANEKEYYIPLSRILFFETENAMTMAHTKDEAFEVRLRLYELEEQLPGHFMRISKSTILNTDSILSIDRSLTSSSLVSLQNSHKQVYVSRHYYKPLHDKLEEKRYFK